MFILWGACKLYQYIRYLYVLNHLDLKTIEVVPKNIRPGKRKNVQFFSIGYAEFSLPFLEKRDFSISVDNCVILLYTVKY